MNEKRPGNADCEQLDDYLAEELSAEEQSLFRQHLHPCTTCGEAAAAQQWIEDWLRHDAGVQSAPQALAKRIETAIRRKRRRQWLGRTAVAAAAGLLGLVFWLPKEEFSVPSPAPDIGNQVATTSVEEPPAEEPEATFIGDSDMIVIPVDSPSSNVTIVEVYPTTSAKRRWEREALLSSSNILTNGG